MWFNILKSEEVFYHSTTEIGLKAFKEGRAIREGTFMSRIREGSRFTRTRVYRIKFKIKNLQYIDYVDWIESVGRSKANPGKYWNNWIYITAPTSDYKILEIQEW